MDYQKEYNDLINLARNRSIPECYSEKHHIIPKALGGLDILENIVVLTAAEHFIAHYYLNKIYGGKMAIAFFMMYNQNRNQLSEHLLFEYAAEYQIIRQKAIQIISENKKGIPFSEEHKRNLSEGSKGKKYSKEICRKRRERMIGKQYAKGIKHSDEMNKKKSEMQKGKKHTEESKKKMSENKKGISFSEEHKRNLSKSNKGRILSDETKKKMSESRKGVKTGKSSAVKGMKWRVSPETGKREYYRID